MSVATITDAQRRLLAAVAQRLPPERVRELHLFAPIRQGGVETGLAVLAVGEAEEPVATEPAPARPAAPAAPRGEGAVDGADVAVVASDVAEEPAEVHPGDDTTGDDPPTAHRADPEVADAVPGAADAASAPDAAACTPQEPEVARAAVLAAEAAVEARLAEEACDPTEPAAGPAPAAVAGSSSSGTLVAVADAALAGIAEADDTAAAPAAEGPASADVEDTEVDGADGAGAGDPAAAAGPARVTVYTARYRLQLKGPDRGKWEVEVVAEADAPLLAVDAVVRGVQRRAGELAEVERLTGDDVRRLLAGAP